MLAMPFSWKGTLAQYCGRLHRNFAGKEEVLIYDYIDFRVPAFDRMYRNRLRGYKQQIPFNEHRFKLSLRLTLPATSPLKKRLHLLHNRLRPAAAPHQLSAIHKNEIIATGSN